jgi:aldehyde:ferredoxin oxidoreductase
MVSRYYSIRGWDKDGFVKQKRKKELEALA